jgi:hypothetical protein
MVARFYRSITRTALAFECSFPEITLDVHLQESLLQKIANNKLVQSILSRYGFGSVATKARAGVPSGSNA